MGVVNKAIENGVRVSGVANSRMPSRHGKLRGDDRRPAPVAVFEDFQEIVTRGGVEGLEAEVVEDQEIGAAEGFQEPWMTPVAARVEAAERAIAIGARTYGSVKSILDHKLDRKPAPKRAAETAPILHQNIRGPRYYH